jgi:hypothetical protein
MSEQSLQKALEQEIALDVCARRWRVDGGVLGCTQAMEHDGACAGDWLVTDWSKPFSALQAPAIEAEPCGECGGQGAINVGGGLYECNAADDWESCPDCTPDPALANAWGEVESWREIIDASGADPAECLAGWIARAEAAEAERDEHKLWRTEAEVELKRQIDAAMAQQKRAEAAEAERDKWKQNAKDTEILAAEGTLPAELIIITQRDRMLRERDEALAQVAAAHRDGVLEGREKERESIIFHFSNKTVGGPMIEVVDALIDQIRALQTPRCEAEFHDDWICGLERGHVGNHGGLSDERCKKLGIPLKAEESSDG